MKEKITLEYIIKFLETKNAVLASNDIGNINFKLKIICNCGNIFYRSLSTIKRSENCLCMECVNKSRKNKKLISYEEVKQNIEKENYKLLSKEYLGNRFYITVMCPNGHIYDVKYNNFQQGTRCPTCNGGVSFTYEFIKNYIENDLNYELLSTEYINCKSKLRIKCDKGHIYDAIFDSIYNQQSKCPICCGNQLKTYEHIVECIEKDGYKINTLKSEYFNVKTIISLTCNKGHNYETTFDTFSRGHRCPHCKRSLGEERVVKFLNESNIRFTPEHKFEDCMGNKRKLPFDFYLEDKNTIIEYDGQFHFGVLFGDVNRYELCISNDNIKNNYCKENNIKLIRIPYWEYNNIDIILKKELLEGER